MPPKRSKKQTPDEIEFELLKKHVKSVIDTQAGRAVIWNILAMCDIYSDSFTGNSTSFHLEGKRSIGLEILGLLEEVDPTIYPNLLLEKQKNGRYTDS